MSELNPSTIHFTLSESVWFEKEQAVDELRSIALNPHIHLFDEQEFIVLKGALELEGEYKQQRSEDEITANEQIYMQSIRLIDEDEWRFSHRFPVDITIPKRKINRVEDVTMTVESFDYEIESDQRLIITANIEIDGISEAEESSIIRNEKKEEEIPLTVVKRNEARIQEVEIDDMFTVEAEIEEEETNEAENEIAIPILREEDYDVKKVELEDIEEDEPVAELEVKQESEQTSTPMEEEQIIEVEKEVELVRNEVEETEEVLERPEVIIEQEPERESSSSYIDFDDPPESSLLEEIDMESSSHEAIPVLKKNKGSTVTMSFAEFFSRKEEELARIKIYVVQDEDSLASIADRYDVSVQQLLRVNHLDITAEVSSGQLLTIPVRTEMKK